MRKIALLPVFAFGVFLAASADAADPFFRAGFVSSPETSNLGDRWLAAFGIDYPLDDRQIWFLGFETASAVYPIPSPRSTTDFATNAYYGVYSTSPYSVVPLNVFLQAKIKAARSGLRPYGGAGVGSMNVWTFFPDYSQHVGDGAFRALGGVEWGRVSAELQVTGRFGFIGGTCYAVLAGVNW